MLFSLLQVHLFSHGGFMYMAAVLQKLAKWAPRNAAAADLHVRICGIILDSSPASVTAGALPALRMYDALYMFKSWHSCRPTPV
jgi:hypothetical protein